MKPALFLRILLALVGNMLPLVLSADPTTATFVLAYRQSDAPEPIDTAAAYRAASDVIRFRLEDLGAKFEIKVHPREMIVRVWDASPELLTQVREKLARSGRIEFCRVHVDSPSGKESEKSPPSGYKALPIEYPSDTGIAREVLWVAHSPAMTSRSISKTEPVPNSFGSFQVLIHLTESGRDRFQKLTKEMADDLQRDGRPRRLAIILEGAIVTAPTVMQAIDTVEISGRFTEREALELSNYLNTPMDQPSIVEQRTE
jgi:preprotein translocase subunit SecD